MASGHQLATTRDPNRFQDIRTAASRREHGSRARYVAGCRCLPCRAANSRYSCQRQAARYQGDCRDLTSAEPAVRHIRALSKLGIGYKTVAEAASVAHGIVADLIAGRRTRIRKNTEYRILQIDEQSRAGGSLVPARETWKLIRQLLKRGYSKGQLALWLGRKTPALQVRKDWITWRTAVAVEKLYRGIEAGRYQR